MPCDAAPSIRLLACLTTLCFAVREGASSAAYPALPLAPARRLNLESCPEFKPFDVPIDSGETKAPVCTWHVADQRCFQSGINSQDNSSFHDVGFHCAMSKAVSVEDGKELRVRGKLDNDQNGEYAELHFQSTYKSAIQTCTHSKDDADFDFCNERHFKVKHGGKLKLMSLHLKGGSTRKGYRRCSKDDAGIILHCWRWSEMNDNSCSGGSIHVASGGQVVLMGVKFSQNKAYKGSVAFNSCFSNTPLGSSTGQFPTGMNVYVERNNELTIGPIFAMNVDQSLDFSSSYTDNGFSSHLLPETCPATATAMCRQFFHRKKCLGSATDSNTKSSMFCGGACIPGHFGANLTEHSDNMTASVCKACPPGQYQAEEGRLSCIMCEAGKYNSAPAQTMCIQCPGGTVSPEGSTQRSNCRTLSCGHGNELSKDGTCVVCPKGKYSNVEPAINSCKNCPQNTFNQDDGSSASSHDSLEDCLPCELMHPMSFSDPGSQFCRECSAGKKFTADGCIECSPGYYRGPDSSNATNCDPCEEGRYQDQPGQPICLACSAGRYQNKFTADGCIECSRGYYRSPDSSNATNCDPCEEGRYQDQPGQPICLACLAGRYQNKLGQVKCKDCPPIKYQNEQGRTSCKVLPRGFIASGGKTTHVEVPKGSYMNKNATFFSKCPEGWIGNSPATTLCEKCDAGKTSFNGTSRCQTCSRGKYNAEAGSTCEECPAGTYQPQEQEASIKCETCPDGWRQPRSGESSCELIGKRFLTEEQCDESQYLDKTNLDPVEWRCLECPVGASCVGDINQDGVRAMTGWWECPSSGSRTLEFERCAQPASCLGAKNQFLGADIIDPITGLKLSEIDNASQCNLGQIQNISTNRRCSACDVDFRPSDSRSPGRCSSCGEHQESETYLALAILSMFLLVVLLIAMKMRSSGRAKASHSVLKRTLLTHVQTLSIILSLNVNWHPSLYEFLVAISSVVNVSAQGSVIQFCSELSKPKDTLEVLAIVLVCASLLPFAFCGLLFAYWMCLAPRCKVLSCGVNLKGISSEASKPESGKSRTRSPWDGFAMSLGLITYIAYPSIIRVSFLILKFVTVCGKRWVFMDEKFEYMGKEHLPIVLGVALPSIIVYSVMLPIFSAFALSKAKRTDPNVIFKYGLVYSGYAERMWYWELVIFFRKFAMILIVTFALEGVMQLQCTLLLLAVMLHVQHQYKPFHARAVDDDNDSSSEEEKNILHQTDLASLCVLFFCVWSASFFKGETENIDGNSDWLLVFAIMNIVGNIILILTVCFQITKLFARRNSKNLSNMRSRIEMISSRMFGKRDVVSDESAGVDKEEIDFTVNVMYKYTKTNEGDDNSRWSM